MWHLTFYLDDANEVEKFAGLADDVQRLKLVHQDGEEEGQDGQQVGQALQREEKP